MSAGYGVAASLGIGLGDHIMRGAAERGGLRQALAAAFLTGAGVATIGALVFPSQWLAADMLLGAVTGLLAFLGLVSLYLGYASATAGVVGPPAAVISVIIPVTVDFAVGGVPGPRIVAGVLVGVLSVMAISYAPHFAGDLRRGLIFSAGAGCSYGTLFVALDQLSPESGFWPVVAQRTVAFCLIALVSTVRRESVFPNRAILATAVLGASCTGVGALSFVYGIQHGDLAPITVTGTQYAAVTVVLGIIFRGERLFWWQAVGLCGTVTAVGLIVTG
ncbi:MAG: DMT family transporter [Actinobacteria bacterium]|nr:DMT family transporter [Actinomycetota bacterium]